MKSDLTLPLISLILSSAVLCYQITQCPEDLKRRIKNWFKRSPKRPAMTRAEGFEEFKRHIEAINNECLGRPDKSNNRY